MRRKHKREEPDNPDRWVVSYADFITLLFAFFTTLYAISHVDLGKLQQFTGSMKTAFKAAGKEAVDTSVIEGIKPPNYADIALEQDIRGEFNKFGIIEGVTVSRTDRGVLLSIGEQTLFGPGSADVKEGARPVLATVASLARKTQRRIVIEGHTDNMPIRNATYPSNIDLSVARAARVFAALLTEGAGRPERISTAGYGEYRPLASNATPEGRLRNRRVDIIFASQPDGT